MSDGTCPECGNHVSDWSPYCTQCGRIMESSVKRFVGEAVGNALRLILACGFIFLGLGIISFVMVSVGQSGLGAVVVLSLFVIISFLHKKFFRYMSGGAERKRLMRQKDKAIQKSLNHELDKKNIVESVGELAQELGTSAIEGMFR